MRKDVNYLKSIDFTSLLEAAEYLDALKTSGIPLTAIKYVHRDCTAVDDTEEKVHDDEVYDDLADLEDVMVETTQHTSLEDTTMVGTSRVVSLRRLRVLAPDSEHYTGH